MGKHKGRSSSDGGYFGLPKHILRHPNFINLSVHAIKLLIDLGEQYGGMNNGDLCATWSMMHKRGWRSPETLNAKLKELKHYGFIVETQLGGLTTPNLYAFTWRKIDKASKDSDFNVGETPNLWKQSKAKFRADTTQKRRARKKKQLRLPYKPATATVSINDNLRVIK